MKVWIAEEESYPLDDFGVLLTDMSARGWQIFSTNIFDNRLVVIAWKDRLHVTDDDRKRYPKEIG